jgi:hypothetical protein
MAKKQIKIGAYIFIAGIVIAIISGILMNVMSPVIITSLLILLGLIVGFLNVTDKEVKDYLLTAVCLVIVTSLGGTSIRSLMIIGPYLAGVLNAIMIFTIPATIVVALKEIISIAKN